MYHFLCLFLFDVLFCTYILLITGQKPFEFSSSPPRPDRLLSPHSLLSNGYRGLFFPGREADLSSPSSSEFKNAWGYSSTPLIRLHDVVLLIYPFASSQ